MALAAAGYVVLAFLGNAFAEQPVGPLQVPNPYAVAGLEPLFSAIRGLPPS